MSGRDPFAVLGLRYDPDVTDEQVRAAFRARLREVHPDSGGREADAVAAAEVTAAYAALRSGSRRGEVLAGLALRPDGWPGARLPVPGAGPVAVRGVLEREFAPVGAAGGQAGARAGVVALLRRGWLRLWCGRRWCLAARLVVGAAVPLVGWRVVPGSPAVPGLVVGAVTWVVATGRWDLAPRARR